MKILKFMKAVAICMTTMGRSRPRHLEGLRVWGGRGEGGGGKDHEAKVTTPSSELWGHAPWKIGSLKQHFLMKFPPTQHIEALN